MGISLTKIAIKYKIKIGDDMNLKQKKRKIVDTKKAIILITCCIILCVF